MPPGSATINVSLVSTNNVAIPGNVGALPTIDGVGVTINSYVLLANQTNATQNGVYFVDPSAGFVPVSGQTAVSGVLNPSLVIQVTGGLNNNDTRWVPNPIVTNPIFVKA